eukprot:UN04632
MTAEENILTLAYILFMGCGGLMVWLWHRRRQQALMNQNAAARAAAENPVMTVTTTTTGPMPPNGYIPPVAVPTQQPYNTYNGQYSTQPPVNPITPTPYGTGQNMYDPTNINITTPPPSQYYYPPPPQQAVPTQPLYPTYQQASAPGGYQQFNNVDEYPVKKGDSAEPPAYNQV